MLCQAPSDISLRCSQQCRRWLPQLASRSNLFQPDSGALLDRGLLSAGRQVHCQRYLARRYREKHVSCSGLELSSTKRIDRVVVLGDSQSTCPKVWLRPCCDFHQVFRTHRSMRPTAVARTWHAASAKSKLRSSMFPTGPIQHVCRPTIIGSLRRGLVDVMPGTSRHRPRILSVTGASKTVTAKKLLWGAHSVHYPPSPCIHTTLGILPCRPHLVPFGPYMSLRSGRAEAMSEAA